MKPLAATVTLPEPTADQREYIERLWSRPPYNPKAMIGAIALMLALSGCAESAAKLATAGSNLIDAGISYQGTIIAKRQEARYECIRLRSQMARDLERAGDLEGAMGAWAVLHRDLTIIQAIQDKDEGAILAGLNVAWPCVSGVAPPPQ